MTRRANLRGCIKAVKRAVGALAVDVVHEHEISRTSSGAITFANRDTRTAVVEPNRKVYRSSDGAALSVKSRLTFLEYVEIDLNDRLTVDGVTGPIVQVSHGLADDAGEGLITTVLLG